MPWEYLKFHHGHFSRIDDFAFIPRQAGDWELQAIDAFRARGVLGEWRGSLSEVQGLWQAELQRQGMQTRRSNQPDPRLVLITPEGKRAGVYVLPEGETRIGRAAENGIAIPDTTVSRSHCILIRNRREVRLQDVNSRNPTRIGGARADGRLLRHGDVLRLGRMRLAFIFPPGDAPGPRSDAAAPATPAKRRRQVGIPSAAGRRAAPRLHPAIHISAAAILLALVSFIGYRWMRSQAPGAGPAAFDAAPPGRIDAAAAIAPPPVAAKAGAAGEAGSIIPAAAPPPPAPVEIAAPAAPAAPGGDESGSDAADEAPPVPAAVPAPPAPSAAPEPAPLVAPTAAAAYFEAHVAPFLSRHCFSCHSAAEKKGDLILDGYRDAQAALADKEVWELVARKLRSGDMPPEDRPRPAAAEVNSILGWIEAGVFGREAGGPIDPGRVTMRRLNNNEYNYTIRDLIGLDLRPADGFPADEIGYGFDNIGDLLSVPPLLMEKYLSAAERIVKAAWEDPAARKRILFELPERSSQNRPVAQKLITAFAGRAFRRPATAAEVARLVKFVDLALASGDDFATGIQLAVQAILVSPHFLFRVELDSQPHNPRAVRQLNDWELASRLSYFLWSSMPDAELLELARRGELDRPAVLEKQVRRMLADEKIRGLTKTFCGLWLGSRELAAVTPDPATYPDFDEALRDSMRRETEMFFEEVLAKDLSLLTFLDADFTFLDERLAKHYGVPGVSGRDHRRVSLDGPRRGGVLNQGTMLTITSNPTRTSPVKRGKWILEQILGAPPPPPPPGVDSLEEGSEAAAATLRERMQRHRRDPNCSNCHERMDAIGLAFENFDGIGAWRERDGKLPIDASGTLAGGRAFRNAFELKAILLENHKDDFARCLAEKLMTFAIGRGLEFTDLKEIERIAAALPEKEFRFSALILEIVGSDLFRKRRGEGTKP